MSNSPGCQPQASCESKIAVLRSRWPEIAVFLSSILATVVWSTVSGKDLNWDQLNYHYYAGFTLATDRLSQDFLAANVQSYLNPLVHLPFYWMVSQHWHSLLIASLLSIVHALNIVLAYLIGKTVLVEVQRRATLATFGTILAFLSPIFLLEAGTTFADITTSVLVLTAVYSALRSDEASAWWIPGAAIAGACIGAATGLKLSNAIFAPACALIFPIVITQLRASIRAIVSFSLCGTAGVVITHGYWSWRLWQEFRNPFLPLFNATFASPAYPAVTHHHERFLPENWVDGLLLPFRMMQLRSWTYVESVAPDLRFAALVLCLTIAGALLLSSRSWRESLISAAYKRAAALLAFFCSAYFLWSYTSGNGRYGIVLSLLCGPLLASSCEVLLKRKSIVPLTLTTLILLQTLHLHNGDLRWHHGPWTRDWYEISIPNRLRSSPYLYVSVGTASNAYVAAFLAPNSAYTNPIGQLSIELQGPGGSRLRQLLDKYAGRVRVISHAQRVKDGDPASLEQWIIGMNTIVSRLGLQVDSTDCLTIDSSGNGREAGGDFSQKDAAFRRLMTCKTFERQPDAAEAAQRERVKQLFRKVTAWCPKLFQPDYTVVEKTPEGWFSNYVDSDTMLHLEGNRLFFTQVRAAANIDLGLSGDWQIHTPLHLKCELVPKKLRRVYSFE